MLGMRARVREHEKLDEEMEEKKMIRSCIWSRRQAEHVVA